MAKNWVRRFFGLDRAKHPYHRPVANFRPGAEQLEVRLVPAYVLQLLHASDYEAGLGALEDARRFAAVVDQLEDDYVNTVIASSGDNWISGPFYSAGGDPALNVVLDSGATAGTQATAGAGRADVEILNRIGLEISNFGNHEYDLGTNELNNVFSPNAGQDWRGAQFAVVQTNIDYLPADALAARETAGLQEASTIKGRIAPTAIITKGGQKIGFVGLTTPTINTIASPGPNVGILPSPGSEDLDAIAAVLQPAIDQLVAAGCNKIILLSHMQQFTLEVGLAPKLKDVDIIVSGGSNAIFADGTDTLRPGDVAVAAYPIIVNSAVDGRPIAVVNTGGNYSYVGRLVAEFDDSGVLQVGALNPAINGAYATTDAVVTALWGSDDPYGAGTKGGAVKQITDALAAVINTKDGNIVGHTDVFLEGRRQFIRTEETNLGSLTADANLWKAKQTDATVGISLKNGGGTRDSIGAVDETGALLPPQANAAAGKAEGDISQLDIENALRFNNALTLVSLDGVELSRLLEHGVSLSGGTATQGRFPQIGGMTMRIDLSKPAGDRIQSLRATNTAGVVVDVIVDGVIVGGPQQFRMVALDFLVGNLTGPGGDNYPFNTLAAPNRVDLTAVPSGSRTFTTEGGEQDALADYLLATFPNAGTPFTAAERAARSDLRVQFVRPDDEIELTHVSLANIPGGGEISAFDAQTGKLFVTKSPLAGTPSLEIYQVTAAGGLTFLSSVDLSSYGATISSVAVSSLTRSGGGIVAVTMIQSPKTAPGKVVFFDHTGNDIGVVTVGSQPDMITFTADGRRALVAIEGEAADNTTPAINNPEGGVSIILLDTSAVTNDPLTSSLSNSRVSFAGFAGFNSQKAALTAAGVRLLPDAAGATVAMDLEPEYITIAPNGHQAWVTLQENNAVALLDFATATFLEIKPLGTKDWSQTGNEFDASDRDTPGASNNPLPGNFKNWPVSGMYMPDGIASFAVGGQSYYITANEGDARPNVTDTADTDVKRLNDATVLLDPTIFPNVAFLKDNDNLGRLNILYKEGDTDGDGDLDKIIALGSRSFTIWSANGTRVFDSGSELERLTFEITPTMFNANNGDADNIDQRSDDKGPEPENVTIGVVNGRTYAFVGLERAAGGVVVYDVTIPSAPTFVQYAFFNDLDGDATDGDDVSPEGLLFISAAQSPTKTPLLIVSNEGVDPSVSGSVSVYRIDVTPIINEFVFNHVGTDTNEFIEIYGAPSTDYSAYTLLVIEGDSATAGTILNAFALGTTDVNGYFLIDPAGSDILQNGSQTLLLVKNWNSGAAPVGTDLDTISTITGQTSDGTLDLTPWDLVADNVGVNDGVANNRVYSVVNLGTAFSGGAFAPGGASRIPNGVDTNAASDWKLNDFDGFGLPGFIGSAIIGQAANTPGAVNVSLLGISAIQGASHTSPFVGQVVETIGVVTALRGNGFYLQSTTPDSNAATSEGIFVFTGSAPSLAVGNLLRARGTVTEFRTSDVNNLTLTQLTSATWGVLVPNFTVPSATVLGAGGRLPPTSVIEDDFFSSFDVTTDGLDFYESLEGMLVQINNAVTVGQTVTFGSGATLNREVAVLADNGAGATGRTPRGGILRSATDVNPERIFLSDNRLGGDNAGDPALPDVKIGDVFGGAFVGVVDYNFGNYLVLATQATLPAVTPSNLPQETTSLVGTQEQLTVATFNVENLDPNDPQAKFDQLADIIIGNLQRPDILSIEEAQDNNGATNDGTVAANLTFQKLIDTIVARGGPVYDYRQIDPVNNLDGGEPGGNIRVGFLFRADRVDFVDLGVPSSIVGVVVNNNGGVPELNSSIGRIDPGNQAFNAGAPGFAGSRKPLVGEFVFAGKKVFVVANHFSSKGGDTPEFGNFQPQFLTTEMQRKAQAEVVKTFVQSILAIDPNANVIVMGDLNDYEFSPPLNILRSAGLTPLVELLPTNERYTYVFDGQSQTLDHILVSANLLNQSDAEVDVVHVNAEYPSATRASDHDPVVARFSLNNVNPVINSLTSSANQVGLTQIGQTVTITGLFSDAGSNDTHTALVHWGDGTTSAATINQGADSLTATHAYAKGGIFQVSVTLTDDDAGSTTADTQAIVTGVGLVGDTLFVIGRNVNDVVKVSKNTGGRVKVETNFTTPLKQNFTLTEVASIHVSLGGGNDSATVGGKLKMPVVLEGGEGNDKLFAGGGAAIVLGGAGDDKVDGGTKRDILIGGLGRDVLLAQEEQDILIGGTTTFDGNLAALRAIAKEWVSLRTYEERITNIIGSGPGFGTLPRENGAFFLQAGATVLDDGIRDDLTGHGSLDWYFADLSSDKLFGRTSAERLDLI